MLGTMSNGRSYSIHAEAVRLQILSFKIFIQEFEKLGENCKYNWTIEQIDDCRLHVSRCIRDSLMEIKKTDKDAYKAVRIVFYDEITKALLEIKQHRS